MKILEAGDFGESASDSLTVLVCSGDSPAFKLTEGWLVMGSNTTGKEFNKAGFSHAICLMTITFCLTFESPVLAEDRLICCGAEAVFVIELAQDETETPEIVWSWKAEDSPEIPQEGRKLFASTDECKPVGKSLLITSSSGGVALVQRSDKRCLFYTQAKNAHSACLLPDDRVAVTSSFGGDELLVYNLSKPNGNAAKPIAKMPLRGAHGVVWDTERKRLWALGSDELLLINLGEKAMDSKLVVENRIELPTPGGHDLSQSIQANVFFLTTNHHVYRFNTNDGTADGGFSPDPALADQPKVKSVDAHPQTGEIVYHQGTPENWWSDTIRFVGERKKIQLPARRLYKIRWDR